MQIAVIPRLPALLLLATLSTVGCSRPKPDDLAAQAARTADPEYRAEAIANTTRMANRLLVRRDEHDFLQQLGAFNRVATPRLVRGFHQSLADRPSAFALLALLSKLEDPNAAPAFAEALTSPSPDRARRASMAARAIVRLQDIPPAKRRLLASALTVAFVDLVVSRPVPEPRAARAGDAREGDHDQRARPLPPGSLPLELIDAMANLDDEGVVVLADLYLRDLHGVAPEVVRELAQRLSDVADEHAVPALVRGLFLRPDCALLPLQSIARDGLLRVGRPAIPALVQAEQLRDPSALRAAELALTVPPNVGTSMTKEELVRSTATDVLVELEAPELFSILADALTHGSFEERARTVTTLILVGGDDEQLRTCREALVELLRSHAPDATADLRSRLVGLVYSSFDARLLPVFLELASDRDEDDAVRLSAVNASVFFADRAEARALRPVIMRMRTPRAGTLLSQLAAAEACDADVGCWRARATDSDPSIARKAVIMLGRLGAPDEPTLTALTGAFDHPSIDVRVAALHAIDHLAIEGAPSVLERIDAMLRRPEDVETRRFNPPALRLARRLRWRSP